MQISLAGLFKTFKNKFLRNCEKKILGTSDAWSMSHVSQQNGKPAYYIVDWQISKGYLLRLKSLQLRQFQSLQPMEVLQLEMLFWQALIG